MAKPNFTLPNKPAIKSGSILSYNYTDDFTFVPAPLTFNRDSAATRVNEKGLIEDVGYFGPELVQNGDFSEIGPELIVNGDFSSPDISMIIGAGARSVVNNELKIEENGLAYSQVIYNGILDSSKIYKATFDITLGTGSYEIHGTTQGAVSIYSSGSYTFYLKSTERFYVGSNGVGDVWYMDNISVKEVGQNWTFQNGWSIEENKVVVANAQSLYQRLTQPSLSFNLNSTYKISVTCSEYSSGYVYLRKPRGAEPDTDLRIDSVGTFVFTLNALTELTEFALAIGVLGTDLSITNISAIEVLGDKPRIDYSDSLTEPSLLLEPQSTNLVTFSEDFSQSNWIKGRTEVLLNTAISPDGNFNASTLSVINATGGEEFLRIISGGSNPATCSIYVKKGNWRYITIRSVNISVFDFDTETFTLTGANETLSFEKLKNGWYRLKASSPTRTYCSVGFAANATATSGSGVNGSYMYIWGAQLEELPYATSYIPTAGSTATRLGETANNAGDVNVFNSEEGVLYAELSTNFEATGGVKAVSVQYDVNNYVAIYFRNDNNLSARVVGSGNVTQVDTTYAINTFYKIAVSYNSSNVKFYVNGTQVDIDTTNTLPTSLNKVSFNRGSTSSLTEMEGKIRNLKVFNKALTDRELEILTIQ